MFGFLKSFIASSKWDTDPGQQELGEAIIINAAYKAALAGYGINVNMWDVPNIQSKYKWSDRELSDRSMYAESMVKATAAPEVYIAAKCEASVRRCNDMIWNVKFDEGAADSSTNS